ncbi:hypothetical protein EOD39_2348 [Acipenser ruthenus]|uniref:Uncharacterized protein n=1 Tax=Acipenser ruthenus TaxID=7906 RepID=A0A444U261_ACIRT|nr:hypothetical protein EOD39_2348 [Acipenser ruthenus]
MRIPLYIEQTKGQLDSAVDTNPLSVYVMQHLWNWIVKLHLGVYQMYLNMSVSVGKCKKLPECSAIMDCY